MDVLYFLLREDLEVEHCQLTLIIESPVEGTATYSTIRRQLKETADTGDMDLFNKFALAVTQTLATGRF